MSTAGRCSPCCQLSPGTIARCAVQTACSPGTAVAFDYELENGLHRLAKMDGGLRLILPAASETVDDETLHHPTSRMCPHPAELRKNIQADPKRTRRMNRNTRSPSAVCGQLFLGQSRSLFRSRQNFGDIADAALNLVFERKRRCGAQKVYIATDPYAATDEKRSVKRWAWEARAKGALRAREYVNLNGDTEVVGGKGKVMDVLRMGSNKQQLQNLVYSVLDKRLEREGLRDGESVFWVAPAPSDGDGHNAWHGDWAGQVRKECIKRLQSTADEADFKFSLCIEHHKSKKESSGHVVVWAEDTDIIADVISRGWEGAQTEGEADILIMRDRRGGTLYNSVQKCAKELQETYPVLGRTLLTGLQALHVLSGCDYTSFCRRLTLSTSAKMETKPCQHWGHSEPSQSLPSLTPRRTLGSHTSLSNEKEHLAHSTDAAVHSAADNRHHTQHTDIANTHTPQCAVNKQATARKSKVAEEGQGAQVRQI
mmetsp:Transcript_12758/g.38215  ORF Transcript_12758/g.38215 Transcript_12758/m.38215 type:complete len:483 (-) Transcript_12758:410-1858(-)